VSDTAQTRHAEQGGCAGLLVEEFTMQERSTRAASELKSPTSSYPPQAPQNQESGWIIAFKTVFWLLLVPSAVLLLFKWLMPA
jgi:hypothetical protein